jgi:hypothetical protein
MRGKQLGGISRLLVHIGTTSPSMHSQQQAAYASDKTISEMRKRLKHFFMHSLFYDNFIFYSKQ